LPARAIELIETTGFGKMLEIRDSGDFEMKILEYADMRVIPRGIVGITERLSEGRARYSGKKNGFSSSQYAEIFKALQNIESNIFSQSKIKPEDVTNESVRNNILGFQNCRID
jgi:hypothetical protein